jgi:hypothetical protein
MQVPALVSRLLPGDVTYDVPLVSLIVANLVTIGLAIFENWDLATVMFIYWAQSIVIGFFAAISLLGADTAALKADLEKPILERGGPGVPTGFAVFYKVFLCGFFCLHYGLFHWGYYFFIVESGIFGTVNLVDPVLWLSCGLFFANHLYSYIAYRHTGRGAADDINEQFFTPYRRIVPMHLTILFGGIVMLVLGRIGISSTLPVLLLFLLLKTRADISAHIDKHARQDHPDEPIRYL